MKINIFDYTLDLELDNNLTLIMGDSGVGKSLIYNYFERQSFGDDKLVCYDAIELNRLIRRGIKLLDELKRNKNCTIVIDNADTVLSYDDRAYIGLDANNRYIIFGRNSLGLWVGTDNVAELSINKRTKKISLNYLFKDINNYDRNMD